MDHSAAKAYAELLLESHPIPNGAKAAWEQDSEMVSNRAEWIASHLDEAGRRAIEHTPVLLLPTSDFNACAATVPDHADETVVLLEIRLTLALEYVVELALWSILTDEHNNEAKHLKLVQSLCDLYTLQVLETQRVRFLKYDRDPATDPAKILLLANAISFVIGHEFAHVIEGHLGSATRALHRVGSRHIEVFNYDQGLELEADTHGFQYVLKSTPDYEAHGLESGLIQASPFFVCVFFGVLDWIHRMMTCQKTADSSHPEGFTRFDNLFNRFGSTIDDSSARFGVHFRQTVLKSLMRLDECDLTDLGRCAELLERIRHG